MENTTLLGVFLTGLLTGGLTCMAVQGGLLASTIAQREQDKLKNQVKTGGHALPIISFLTTKLIAYTILGFLLGSLGSVFQLSLVTKTILQVGVALFMLATALNMLEVHPIFRYFVIQPPKFLTRLVRKESKSNDMFAPAILGAFTVFIPCGTTQAMMALAIASSSPILGATILFFFVLGTSPVFFLLGYMASRITGVANRMIMKIAAFVLILLSIYNLNGAVALTGSDYTIESLAKNVFCTFAVCDKPLIPQAVASETTIQIENIGYSPNNFSVKAGSDVTIHIVNNGTDGCAQAFTIPTLGIQKVIPKGSSSDITFKAPKNPTTLSFMCSMGMYKGTINVI